MKRDNILKNQKGFTLIEIIAVLILLGILAAVAVPKFVNLTSDAEAKAVQGALGAAASNVGIVNSKMLLADSGVTLAELVGNTGLSQADYTTVGDFTVSYAAGTGDDDGKVVITITDVPDDYNSGTGEKKTVVVSVASE